MSDELEERVLRKLGWSIDTLSGIWSFSDGRGFGRSEEDPFFDAATLIRCQMEDFLLDHDMLVTSYKNVNYGYELTVESESTNDDWFHCAPTLAEALALAVDAVVDNPNQVGCEDTMFYVHEECSTLRAELAAAKNQADGALHLMIDLTAAKARIAELIAANASLNLQVTSARARIEELEPTDAD